MLRLMDCDCPGWAMLYLDLLLVMASLLLVCPGRPEVSLGWALGPVLSTAVSQGLASCTTLIAVICLYLLHV